MAGITHLNVPFHATGIGPPPGELDAEQAAAWHELVALAPAGAWLASDRIWLELTAHGLVQLRRTNDPEWRRETLAMLSKGLLDRDALTALGIEYAGVWPIQDDAG